MEDLQKGESDKRAFENRIKTKTGINYPYALLGKDLRLLSVNMWGIGTQYELTQLLPTDFRKNCITITNIKYEKL
jgi:hypothetical protein